MDTTIEYRIVENDEDNKVKTIYTQGALNYWSRLRSVEAYMDYLATEFPDKSFRIQSREMSVSEWK